jgi:uncharacterized protein (UPF0335 family)
MEAQTLPQTEGLSFEKVWAMFQETDRKFQETDRKFQENERKRLAEWEALQKQFKETDRKISRLGNRIGDLIQVFTAANILEKFQALGFEVSQLSQNMRIQDQDRHDLAEVDIFLENGDSVIAVEVKTNLVPVDVAEHLHRMDVLRTHANSRGDSRKYLGAIAAAVASEGVKKSALSEGFYVMEQMGDNVRITAPENARVW